MAWHARSRREADTCKASLLGFSLASPVYGDKEALFLLGKRTPPT